jgi:hypothetical protein
MSEKKRKFVGKTIAERLDIIVEVNKKERSKSDIADLRNTTLHTVDILENRDSIKTKLCKEQKFQNK